MDSKIIRGCWQLSCDHSLNERSQKPIEDAIEKGFNIFDCGDIYLGVEELLGRAIQAYPQKKICIHTKFVPDRDILQCIDFTYIEKIIDRSLKRLKVDALDLVQFHWWDWEVENYLFALESLFKLKEKGKIVEIGLTNMDCYHFEECCSHFPIYSLQIQASLIDKRFERGMGALSKKYATKIFAYGTLLGGFLHEKWLGIKEPPLETLENRSLVKYKLLIDAACGWEEFQRRLRFLDILSKKVGSDIGSVALSALLKNRAISAAIVGLSPTNYATQNTTLTHLPALKKEDIEVIDSWECYLDGDIYQEERDKNRPHAKSMKYNLNLVS